MAPGCACSQQHPYRSEKPRNYFMNVCSLGGCRDTDGDEKRRRSEKFHGASQCPVSPAEKGRSDRVGITPSRGSGTFVQKIIRPCRREFFCNSDFSSEHDRRRVHAGTPNGRSHRGPLHDRNPCRHGSERRRACRSGLAYRNENERPDVSWRAVLSNCSRTIRSYKTR